MRTIVAIYVMLSSTLLSAQTWKNIQYEEILTFSLPDNYELQDTAGMKIYNAYDSAANYQCLIVKGDFDQSASQKELEKNYEGFLRGMRSSMPGFHLVKKEFTMLGPLKALHTVFSTTLSEQPLKLENLSVYVNSQTFNFSAYTSPEDTQSYALLRQNIQFNQKLDINAQLNSTATLLNPEKMGYIAGYAVPITLAIVLGIRYARKNKQKQNEGSR